MMPKGVAKIRIQYRMRKAARAVRNRKIVLVIDIDGVLTDGRFLYDARGKSLKTFGAEDHDAVSILSKVCDIRIITADERGFAISQRRVLDMNQELTLVKGGLARAEFVRKIKRDGDFVIFVGDSTSDVLAAKESNLVFSPSNSSIFLRKISDVRLVSEGARGALMETAELIMKFFFNRSVLDEF